MLGTMLLPASLALLSAATAVGAQGAGIDPASAAAAASNQSLLWGTYRPQLYHGLRPRLPHSLMTGLSWFGLNDYRGWSEIRHTCEQSDALSSYTYTQHDGRRYAAETLVDGKNNVRMNVTFLKADEEVADGGWEWAVRVEGDSIDPAALSRTSLIYHFGLEGLGEISLESATAGDDTSAGGIEGDVRLSGSSMELGEFEISIVDHVNNPPPIIGAHHTDFEADKGRTRFLGAGLPTGSVWKVKDLFQHSVGSTAQSVMGSYKPENPPDPAYLFKLPNHVAASSNVLAFQKQFAGSGVSGGGKWGFDIVYQRKPVSGAGRRQNEASTSEQSLTAEIEQASSAYDARFAETFTLPAEYSSPEYTAFAQACTSNLVGGIGYFYGDSIIDRSFKHGYDDVDTQDDWDEDDKPVANGPEKTPERALFTATPSRPFFPRGFYWDEGFHLAIIGDWDNDLTLDILKSWVDAIDENGWVAREQIMGEESRSKVPPEFQTQYPSAANPPTLPMAVTAFITRLKRREEQSLLDEQLGLGSRVADASERGTAIHSRYLDQPKLAQDYLLSIYPALRRHYLWFRRTQRGGLREWGRKATSRIEAYRWRGRTEEHVLTSGLDDYPRARPPHAGELHVDLMSWMGFFARTMAEVAEYLGEEDDLAEYQRHERGIRANLEDLHWSERDQAYCDVTIANVEDEEGYGEERSVHVCHKGYISLFPLMLQHVDVASPHVGAVLDLISSPNELWSPYGIRSLSRSHPLYRQGEDYWRGPIWIQMNWMVLKALHEKYAREEGPYKERAKKVYDELRRNVVENVFKEYQRTGYVWEQYDPDTGEGRRSHPFTGWTSLVTLIMTERY